MPSSSIFKSICAAAAILAIPTSAQIGNWDILYQSLETDFQEGVTNEITLDYLIGTGRTFNIDLFDKDCIAPITGMNIITTTARMSNVDADHDGLEIMLDLDKSSITSSNIWDDSKLEFCIRVQLLSGGAVIKEDKRDIDIFFDFTVDFEAVEDVSMQTASLSSGSGQANVDSYVMACKCDDLDSFTCNNTPLAPNSILNVCIQSMDSDVEIAFLNTLEITSLDNETLLIVDGLLIQNNEISSLTVKNATAVGVSTVVPSRFFSFSTLSSATVSGIVQVKLVGGRALRGEEDSVVSRPGRYDPATPFTINVPMEPLPQVSHIKTGFDDGETNAGSRVGGCFFFGILFIAAHFILVFVWSLF